MVVAPVGGVLDEDELVVALVARHVARTGDTVDLDHADDLLLELDGGVQVS